MATEVSGHRAQIRRLVPLGRWQDTPEDIAARAVFLASAKERHRPDDKHRRRVRDALVRQGVGRAKKTTPLVLSRGVVKLPD
ncbi:MAG: hypothetical protein JO329_14525 [Planctomycetaceae bacterium]|nr:hypothetical protein [Planctomycetaceae bacterium]MBV8270338.1 hypothetical protein [Planctomycetaceae bacterium]MBV8315396.1 hypothetical protein [Planctomycetaceae bacterium]MBV8381673.1 hypothetical protein [Planctomycetaceae bacterium]